VLRRDAQPAADVCAARRHARQAAPKLFNQRPVAHGCRKGRKVQSGELHAGPIAVPRVLNANAELRRRQCTLVLLHRSDNCVLRAKRWSSCLYAALTADAATFQLVRSALRFSRRVSLRLRAFPLCLYKISPLDVENEASIWRCVLVLPGAAAVLGRFDLDRSRHNRALIWMRRSAAFGGSSLRRQD
jgi:hypothetical protein